MRRAAAKLVASVVVSQPELLPTIYPQAAPALVARFREREENVKADVFSAFVDLLHMVSPSPVNMGNMLLEQKPHAASGCVAAARIVRGMLHQSGPPLQVVVLWQLVLSGACCTYQGPAHLLAQHVMWLA